jgi:hypothetical protein
LIEGAAPGSVRVVFKSAPAFVKKSAMPGPGADILFDAGETSTSESVALREIANILSSASDADNFADAELGAALGLVPAGAHNLLFEAISTAASAEWEISGSVRQRGIGRREVTLTKRGASRLTTLLRPMKETVETLELRGTLDGYKPSEARMWLRPKDSQRSLVVLVQTPDLLRQVKDLNAVSEEVNVAVTVKVIQWQSVSSGQVQSTTRDLVSVVQGSIAKQSCENVNLNGDHYRSLIGTHLETCQGMNRSLALSRLWLVWDDMAIRPSADPGRLRT